MFARAGVEEVVDTGVGTVDGGMLPTAVDSAAETRQRQRTHWERLAGGMVDLYPAPSTQYYRRCEIALIQRHIGSLRGKRVLKLDLWNEAFNTRILSWMRSQGAETFGIDVSAVITSTAKRRSVEEATGPVCLAQADIRYLPFASDSFDFLYTMGTIEHIDEYPDAVAEIARVLRPGGKAIIGVPHRWNIFLRPLLVKVLDRFDKYPYSPEKSFSAGELRRVLEAGGLRVRARSGVLSIPGLLRMAELFCFRRGIPLYRLTPLLLWPFDFLETRYRWPGYFGYLIAMVGEKITSAPSVPRESSPTR